MGKALEEINAALNTLESRREHDIYYSKELTWPFQVLRGLKAVVIALEDIAKAIRER